MSLVRGIDVQLAMLQRLGVTTARVGYVYVGKKAALQNWGIGISGGVWGWETSVLDRADGHDVAGSLREGDLFVLARGGPSPRTKPGSWRSFCLEEAWIASVTRPLYMADSQFWPDKLYPHRIDLTGLVRIPTVAAEVLGDSEAMEKLRLSGNKQGGPVLGQLVLPDEPSSKDASGGPTDAPPNRLATVVVRAEQSKLREMKFGDNAEIACDLCGRIFPKGSSVPPTSSAARNLNQVSIGTLKISWPRVRWLRRDVRTRIRLR